MHDDPRLALLRLSRSAVTCDLFDAATRLPNSALRWAAMRAWLTADAEQALPRLRAMAEADRHDNVRIVAARTLAMMSATDCC